MLEIVTGLTSYPSSSLCRVAYPRSNWMRSVSGYSSTVRVTEYHKELFNKRQARHRAIEPLRVCTLGATFS